MSKMRVYGQQVQIFINDGTRESQRLGEVMSFNYKSTDVVKKHSSLGETGVGTIDVLDDGGTLSFELDKSDSKFASFFALMHHHLRGGDQAGYRGKAPYFTIKQFTRYADESTETLVFAGVVLHDDEGSVSGRTEVYSEKFQATYKKRYIETGGSGEAPDKTVEGLKILANALAKIGDLNANTSSEFADTSKIKDYSLKGRLGGA